MALVKGPALSMDASGNLGGICYSHWRGMHVARDPWTGTVPNTSLQIGYQDDLTSVAQAWGGLLDGDDRQAWEDYSKSQFMIDRFGQKYTPSGYSLFMSMNMNRARWNLAVLLRPLHDPEPMYAEEWDVEWDAPNTRVHVRIWSFLTTGRPDKLEYWKAGPYDSGGRKPIAGEWRLKLVVNVGGRYYDNSPQIGKTYWYKARMCMNTGVVSNFIQNSILIPSY